MNIERQSLIRGVVQIMATGILAIGLLNSIVISWAWLFDRNEQALSRYYPLEITMAFPTALALVMTGLCLLLMAWNPRIKTKYFRKRDD